MRTAALSLAATLSLVAGARAEDICEGKVLRDAGAIEMPTAIIRRGDGFSMSSYITDERTGQGMFCQRGNYCWPSSAIRLTNCKLVKKLGTSDYDLVVIRSMVAPTVLRRAELEDRLEELDIPHAMSGTVADAYLAHPRSKCGLKVKATLEGNPVAKQAILDQAAGCN